MFISWKKFGFVLYDVEFVVECILCVVQDKVIIMVLGKWILVEIDIICVYGDELSVVVMV